MKRLEVDIEIMGRRKEVGSISGDSEFTAAFAYSPDYVMSKESMPISVNLPLREEPFSPEQTRSFFEGLLPEGFVRSTIAKNNRVDADDYLSLLNMLGSECSGAITVREEDFIPIDPGYKKLEEDILYELAAEGAAKSAELLVESRLSLTGASGKIGAYRSERGDWYLPLGGAASTHIMKQSHIRYDGIVQNEQLALMTAAALGIDVSDSMIVDTQKRGHRDEILLATKRYDRTLSGSVRKMGGMDCPLRLHQEDFAQAMGISAANKYESAGEHQMRDMFRVLREKSAFPIEDQIKLWDMIVFHYLIGNTDGHIKNFSLLYDEKLRSARLAPAYDIVSTIVYSNHSSDMAFAIGGVGKWEDLGRSAFEKACLECRLNTRLFMKRYDDMAARFDSVLTASAEKLARDGYSESEKIAETIIKKHRKRNK